MKRLGRINRGLGEDARSADVVRRQILMHVFYPVLDVFTGAGKGIRRITIDEAGAHLVCFVWEDSLWVAVKDIALLSVYERAGVCLSGFTGTVIDAGSHVGLFSIRAALYARRVISLEPDPLNYTILQLNIARNRLTNVLPLRSVLWTTGGQMSFNEGSHSHSGSIVGKGHSTRAVDSTTLERLIVEHGPIELLKVDIEGAEFDVLMSVPDHVLDQVDQIVAELDLAPGRDERALRRRLEASGFRVSLLDPPIMSTRESLRKIFINWPRLGGVTRLKIAVVVVYLLEPILRPLIRDGERVRTDGPRYLFARRVRAERL